MVDMTLTIAITVLIVYAIVLLLLSRSDILERMNIEIILGFLIMWRTERGKALIERLSKHESFWRQWGNLSLLVVAVISAATLILLCWEAFLVVFIPPDLAPSPELLIGIPGINPIIPVGYGILSLVIAIVIHEFSHGILTRVAKVKIRSLGVIAVIVPIGAFVEPDEESLGRIGRRARGRVYAAGPMSNIVLALVCALIFSFGFMGSVEPVEDGMVVTSVTVDYPAHEAGLRPWMLITAIQTPNFTEDDLVSSQDFDDAMSRTHPGEEINITYYFEGEYHTTNATLEDKYEYYKETYPDLVDDGVLEGFRDVGFLGVRTMSLREDVIDTQARPVRGASSTTGFFAGALKYISLPLMKLSPMPDELSSLMVVEGPLGALPVDAFWVLANSFYWLFWLNFMVGATNALPARPLDGGFIFRDAVHRLLGRFKKDWEVRRIEKTANRVSLIMSLVVLFLIIWLVLGPWVAAWFRGIGI